MIKNFGENLKRLRKEKNLTQDEIAKILNVSTQTISRWETNMGYPDIEMLPAIANFYDVTVDSLLCMDINKKKEKISGIVDQINLLRTKGEINTCIEICRDALKEFPNDFQIMSSLSSCLFNHGETTEEINKNNEEVIEICETILNDCKDDFIRHLAILLLSLTYPKFDKKEKALEMAKSMPNYFITSNELLRNIINNDEKKQHIQGNLVELIQIISRNIEELFILNTEFEGKINILNSWINIYKGFFDSEDYYFFHSLIHPIYRYKAAINADKKIYDETVKCIEKAAYHAMAYDSRPEEHTYISSIFMGLEDSIINSFTNSTSNNSWTLLNKLNDERYDFIRKDAKFIDITEKLKQIAKK